MELFKRQEDEEVNIDDYTEIPLEISQQKAKIFIERLDRFADSDKVVKKVRDGDIVFVMIKKLKEENMDELKHAISKIKTVCATIDGDLVGVGDEWLIVAPKSAKICR